ncbi:hypothetical protein BMW23_0529 [Bodo saltans virus]|uniref:C3H1-type domain-containing protein n=1 Tax=Bodo saltans virus TaxID=2024608 RepID=A0A2H4UUN6_9VIRU|nr:hypothetical protein QJ851_gp0513 [Bodo saltans virus]ATZ80576.1 hypothetical protein BMW23_0529 [Bodo saltans virus]
MKNERWIKVPTTEKKKKKEKEKEKEKITSEKKIIFSSSLNDDTEISSKYMYDNFHNNNLKKILCENMIYNGECKYDQKCLYAHNIDEQNINDKRKYIYDLIDIIDDLSQIDLKKDYSMYKSLLELTRMCKKCMDNMCIGGYNCKLGACVKKYCICANDLNNGLCKNPNCDFVHLTKKGLKPYYKKEKKYVKYDDKTSKNTESTEETIIETTYKIDDLIDIFDDLNIIDDDKVPEHEIYNALDYMESICDKSIFS